MLWTPAEQRAVQQRVWKQVISERDRQDLVWGHLSPQTDYELLTVLTEELGEAAREMLPGGTAERLDAELTQVMAVAGLWKEAIQLRKLQKGSPFSSSIHCGYPLISRQVCVPCAHKQAHRDRRIWQLHSALHVHAGEKCPRHPADDGCPRWELANLMVTGAAADPAVFDRKSHRPPAPVAQSAERGPCKPKTRVRTPPGAPSYARTKPDVHPAPEPAFQPHQPQTPTVSIP